MTMYPHIPAPPEHVTSLAQALRCYPRRWAADALGATPVPSWPGEPRPVHGPPTRAAVEGRAAE